MKKIFYKISISKIVIIIVFTIIISFVFLNYQGTNNNNFGGMMSGNNQENTNIQIFQNTIFTNKLNIPEVLIPTAETGGIIKYSFEIKSGETEFFKGIKTKTLAYNGDFLGSTIRVKNGQKISFEIKNNLEQDTTVHWHGLHIPAEYDGGVFQVIKPGEIYKPKFEIKQTAGTFWYHPHLDGNTAFQAYKGLAGLFIIDDEISEKLDIPKSYGIDDIPLIIQDKYFDKNGQFVYANSMHTSINGMYGDKIIVNGTMNSYFEVTNGIVRFRLLNGSNARIYNFKLSNNQEFYEIATDGGFIEKPVKLNSLQLSPGERTEILIDFSKFNIGDSVILQSSNNGNLNIIEFRVTKETKTNYNIPKNLVKIDWLNTDSVNKERTFVMKTMERGMMGNLLTINGKNMDLNRVDEIVKLGDTEIWMIQNIPGFGMNLAHSFHIHDMQFQILERNGQAPKNYEKGWKDTVFLNVGDKVKIIVKFTDYTGNYMYHCHILEHEDKGMMGVFEVVK